MDTAYIKVNIDYGMEIFLPNAFTPNGDGLNDVFGLHGQTFQHLKGFYIYNRYGQEVYFSQDVNAGWDGTQNGQPCDVGVYYYMLEVVLPNGKAKAHKGEVHLIR